MRSSGLYQASLLTLLWGAACQKSEAAPLAPLPPAVHIASAAVELRPMPRTIPLTGSLVANQQADVAANASGRVVKTYVERGAYVRADAPLAQLEGKTAALSEQEAKANLETAQAQFELATAQCNRNQDLFKNGVISKDEWDRISSQCRTTARSAEAAHARAELASKQVADSTVRAPFAGMIAERFVSVGEYVQPATHVVTLVELDPLRLQLTVAEGDLAAIHQGQKVLFDVQSYPKQLFSGEVRYIGPAVRSATRDLVVEAVVENHDHTLRPGMFATAHLQLPDDSVPAIPVSSLRRNGTTTHIFAVLNNRIEERAVQVGPERDGYVAILDGLHAGDIVVSELTNDIKDGVPTN